jgi:hypothetical protein
MNESSNCPQVSHQCALRGLFIGWLKGSDYNAHNTSRVKLPPLNTLRSQGHYSPFIFTIIFVPHQS